MATPEHATPDHAAASSAAAFKQKAQERTVAKLIELPSGLAVSVKRPSVTTLMKVGIIPSDVAASIQAAADTKGALKGDQLKKYLELVDILVINSVTEPVIRPATETPTENEISIDDIDDTDKSFIANYVQTGVHDLTPFRTQP